MCSGFLTFCLPASCLSSYSYLMSSARQRAPLHPVCRVLSLGRGPRQRYSLAKLIPYRKRLALFVKSGSIFFCHLFVLFVMLTPMRSPLIFAVWHVLFLTPTLKRSLHFYNSCLGHLTLQAWCFFCCLYFIFKPRKDPCSELAWPLIQPMPRQQYPTLLC